MYTPPKGSVLVSFLLLRNLPMGFFVFNVSTRPVTTCTGEKFNTQGATDVLSAQVGSKNKRVIDESLSYIPIGLNFSFVATINHTLESYRCVYWNFSEP